MLGLAAAFLAAQSVQVYSEFTQLNDAGEVLAPENPREILSPAVARNAFSSFQLAIQVPRGVKFLLYIGQNPDNAANVTLYRRDGGKLVPVVAPYEGTSSQVLWMDLWVDGNAPVRRVKIEPQVEIGGDWVTYPMEVRVMEARVPDQSSARPGVADSFEVMREFLCGGEPRPLRGSIPIGAEPRFRNARQDVALAAPKLRCFARRDQEGDGRMQRARARRSRILPSPPRSVVADAVEAVSERCSAAARRARLVIRAPNGEMAEWLKAHAWKACLGETLTRVRIPLSPPYFRRVQPRRLQRGAVLVLAAK